MAISKKEIVIFFLKRGVTKKNIFAKLKLTDTYIRKELRRREKVSRI